MTVAQLIYPIASQASNDQQRPGPKGFQYLLTAREGDDHKCDMRKE